MKKYSIYIYIFKNQYCYIGLTNNIERRDKEHHHKGAVYNYSKYVGESIPEVIILETDLDNFSAQKSEENWCEFYKSSGYTLINSAKVGVLTSSLGSMNKDYLGISGVKKVIDSDLSNEYRDCYEEAKKYSSIKEFRINNINCYYKMLRYGWDFKWLKRDKSINSGKKNMNFDEIKSIASKFSSRTEFSLKEKTLYMKCLNDGSIDELFPKHVRKTKIKDDLSYTDEELNDIMLQYNTKTEFAKSSSKLYNICRIRGLLNNFHKKKVAYGSTYVLSKDEMVKISADDFSSHINDFLVCEKYPDYYFNKDGLKLFKKHKNFVSSVRCHKDKLGFINFKIGKKFISLNCIINDFVFNGKYNLISKKVDDVSSIYDMDYSIIDLSGFVELKELDTFLLNKEGVIYSIKHKSIMKSYVLKNHNYFCGFRVDRLVYKYFSGIYDPFKKADISHNDNNLLNDKIDNLSITFLRHNFNPKNIFYAIKTDNSHELYIHDKINNKDYFLGLIKNDKILKTIKIEIINRYKDNENINEWFYKYKEENFKEWQKKDREINEIIVRTNSDGCYFSEIHNLWKSKIFYNKKEYSLGYFKTFEAGKTLYEEAIVYIKHNSFDKWYSDIELHRERIKKYFE